MSSENLETDLKSSEESKSVQPAVPSAKVFVKDLEDRQQFHSTFLIKDKTLLVDKKGKSYIGMSIADSSGQIDARIWDNVDSLTHVFQSGDVVKIKGQIQIFQNRKQAVVHKLERVDSSEINMTDFVTQAARSGEEMFQQLMQYVGEVQNHHIKQLLSDTLTDPEIRSKLLRAPAAKTIHHAYLGGLLEHIISICGVMKALAMHYRLFDVKLNLDFLYFGAIYHDIGKIWELQYESSISYTDRGKLIGHMVMAVELVEKKASRILAFPEDLKVLLKHIILSHHGKLEYGSPKLPMFLEAVLVASIDDLDSKINTIDMFMKSERASGEDWSKFNQMFERYFYLRSGE